MLCFLTPHKRCNIGNNQQPLWNTPENTICTRRHLCSQEEQQNDMECLQCKELPPPQVKRQLPLQATSNGKTDLLGLARNPIVQELTDLESQIQIIKQQLQLAMKKKKELEQYQQVKMASEP